MSSSAPFDGSPPSVLVLGGGGLLGEAWMTGVLAGYEDAAAAGLESSRLTRTGGVGLTSLFSGSSLLVG